jgi:hypothetical protein
MTKADIPFDDNGEGFPTPDSVRTALSQFNLDRLSEVEVSYMGQEGSMVDLISRCQIDRLTQNWPKDFIAQVVGAAAQAGKNK